MNLEMRTLTCWEVSLSAPWPRSGLGDVSRAMWVTRAGVGGEKFDAMEAPWSPDSPGAPLVSVGRQFLCQGANLSSFLYSGTFYLNRQSHTV